MGYESPDTEPKQGAAAIESSDDAAHLETYLAARDEACPSCAYNLRGLKGAACPECGQALTLRVGLEHPNLAAFVTGLIGISAAFGFCAMVMLWGVYVSLMERWGPSWDELAFLAIEVTLNGLVLWVWIRRSAWIRRQPHHTRWSLAAACWLLPPITLIAFVNSI